MRIESVTLENVKSYADAVITFSGGTNAICGHNGAGKSTILEAIGFALFDYLQTPQADLVRTGEKTATVTVALISEERAHFQVVRACGGSPKYQVYRDLLQVADGKAETVAWLHRFFGIPEHEDLPTIFKDAVGVPQGLLTTAFLETPSNRKRVFGPLLHVDDYETAWSKLRDAERILEGRKTDIEKQLAVLAAALEPWEGTKQQYTQAAEEQETVSAELDGLQEEMNVAIARKSQLDYLSGAIQGAEEGVTRVKGELALAEQRAATAKETLAKTEAAVQQAEDTRADHDEYQGLQTQRAEVGEEIPEASAAALRQNELMTMLKHGEESFEALVAELEGVETTHQEYLDFFGMIPQQEQLEQRITELREASFRQEGTETLLANARRSLEEAESIYADAKSDREKIPEQERLISEAEGVWQDLDMQLGLIKDDGVTIKTQIETLQERKNSLIMAGASCPICETPLTPERVAQLIEQGDQKIDELTVEKDRLGIDWSRKSTEIREQEKKLTGLRAGLARLIMQVSLESLKRTVDQRRAEVERLSTQLDEAGEGPLVLKTVEAQLAELGDPRAEAAVRKWSEAKMEVLKGAIETARASIEEIGRQADELAGANEIVQALYARQRQIDERLSALEEAYQKHVASANAGASIEADKEFYAQALLLQQEKAVDLRTAETALAEFAAAYDKDEHALMAEQVSQMSPQIATLQERERSMQKEINALGEALASFAMKDAELKAVALKASHVDAVAGELAFLRQTIREAGPEIVKMMVASISITADALYGEIAQDPTASLEWSEDYEIFVTTDGQRRRFSQLSGGEQMAAALAVRLSLLQEISDIDFAFFDEPTVNLDAQRRESLAHQILNVKGFSQLFVISHDDSFEQGTNNVVRVRKVDGATIAA